MNLSNALIVSGAAIWVANLLWVAVTPDKYKTLSTIKLTVDHQPALIRELRYSHWINLLIIIEWKVNFCFNTLHFADDEYFRTDCQQRKGFCLIIINRNRKLSRISPVIEPNTHCAACSFHGVADCRGKILCTDNWNKPLRRPLINELDKPIKDAELFYNTITTRYTFEKENVKLLRMRRCQRWWMPLIFMQKGLPLLIIFWFFMPGMEYGKLLRRLASGFHPMPGRAANLRGSETARSVIISVDKIKTHFACKWCCFGGSIFKSRSAFTDATLAINMLYELPSRKAMTSGTLTEVPDQSAFLKYMIDRLQNNFEKYLSSEQLLGSSGWL